VATPAAAISRRTGTAALIEALRPRQWTKNVFVFAGLVFGGRLFDRASILRELGAFAIFCVAASAVYLANDAADREHDARHPLKRARPVASGRLPVPFVLAVSAALSAVALAASAALSRGLLWIVVGYLAMSFAYSAGLKRVFLVDVMIVAFGFVLRAAAGAAVLGVEISPWLLCCSFLLALFLGLGKRRAELSLLGDSAVAHRVQPRVEIRKEAVDRVVVAASRPERLVRLLDRRDYADRDRAQDRDSRGALKPPHRGSEIYRKPSGRPQPRSPRETGSVLVEGSSATRERDCRG